MKKILILTNNDVGLYKFRKELIKELLLVYEVYISLPYGEYVDELIQMGCKYIETKISRRGKNPFEDFKLLKHYKKILEEVEPECVFTYTIKPNVYGGMMCKMLKIPYISNVTGFGSAVENGGMLKKITTILYRLGLQGASCVFFQNRENIELANKYKITNGNYKLIPGSGVNLDYFLPLKYPAGKEINFLFISRIMEQKGINQYLEAAEFIKKKYPHTNFHILGSYEENYEEKITFLHEEGIVKYHGMQKDLRVFHDISHCTVHPTYYPEGISNVLLETAACARPIIATNRTGCKEVVEHRVNGLLIEERSSTDLINKIEDFLSFSYDEKKQMGLNGRRKVEQEFDRRIVVTAYLDELRKIIS